MATTLPESGFVSTEFGDFAVLDLGGEGRGALLAHDALDNAEYWRPAGELMSRFCHPVAVDLQGHGQTAVRGLTQQQHIEALRQICDAFGFDKPLLAGEGAGGWLLTVGAVTGQLDPGALLMLECAFGGSREQMEEHFAQFDVPEFFEMTVNRLRLGARVPDGQEDLFVEDLLSAATHDWSFDEIPRELLEPPVRRSLLRQSGGWLRQPDRAVMVGQLHEGLAAEVKPSGEVYRGLDVPIRFLMTSEAMYHDMPAEIEAMVAQDPRRSLTVVRANYNVSLTHSRTVAREAKDLVLALDDDADG